MNPSVAQCCIKTFLRPGPTLREEEKLTFVAKVINHDYLS